MNEKDAILIEEYKAALHDARERRRRAEEAKDAREVKILRGMVKSLEWTIRCLERCEEENVGATLVEPKFFDTYRGGEASDDPWEVLFGEERRTGWEVPQIALEKTVKSLLTKNERIVLSAKLSGMSLREIAEHLDLSYGSLRAYLRRADAKIAKAPPIQTTFVYDDVPVSK